MSGVEILSSAELTRAAALLKSGQLVSFPTETVYGLGACIFNEQAIQSIFKVKGRPSDNPLIAHVCSIEQVSEIAEEIPDLFYRLAQYFFPGPLTIILKRRSHVPPIVSAGLPTVAVRMPSHPLALNLIELVGEPLVAPSANLSGKPSSTQVRHVLEDFEGKIAAVIDGGKTEFGIESTVLSLMEETPTLMRHGAISKEVIEDFLNGHVKMATVKGPASSPGMKYRHYSPQAPIKMVHTLQELKRHLEMHSGQDKIMLLVHGSKVDTSHFLKREIDQFALETKELYFQLRLADEKNYQQIVIFCDEQVPIQSALMDRLIRAGGS